MSSKKLLNLKDFERYAIKHLSKMAEGYYNSGSNFEHTLKENQSDFLELKIKPKFLDFDVSKINLKTKILESNIDFPIGIAPTAMQKLAHPEGELATARACEKQNTIFILSTIATSSIEEVATAAPFAIKWFQLYVYKNRKLTENLIKNAEKFNFKALVLTIDAPEFGTRYADVHNNFHLPENLRMANFDSANLESKSINDRIEGNSGISEYVKNQFDPTLTWEILGWLKKKTKLPIILKGVLTAETALKALEYDIDGIIVSNHGGRQLDCTTSTIMALPEIINAVSGRTEVYLDCGVRTGTDVLKALCLGAKGVFVGRPALYGLCYNGQKGVEDILQILKSELELALKLSGCNNVLSLDKSYLTTKDEYRKKLKSFLKGN